MTAVKGTEGTKHVIAEKYKSTYTHTHDENRTQEQSNQSGERKLIRTRRAALDVFRSVHKEWQSADLDCGHGSETEHPCSLATLRIVLHNGPRRTSVEELVFMTAQT